MKRATSLLLSVVLVGGGVPLAPAASLPPVAQAAPPLVTMEDGLRQVIDEALTANLELRASGATVQQRLAALDQARARYLPVIDFAARYSMADGGRTIEFPVGDLLNPVYETLDQMLVAQGQPPQFPRVQNQSIALLRDQEQETKLVLEQPLYEPRIGPAVDATRADAARAEADLAALRSQVIRDVKQAYYRWIAAQQAVTVLDATLAATRENLRANESLYRNGKVTRDLVYRAEADVLEVEQERLATASRVRIAQSYVNLLRNAPLSQPLPNASLDAETIERFRARLLAALAGRPVDASKLQDLASQRREELKGLDAAIAVGEARQDLARAAFKPSLAFGAEAGIQGTEYGFADDDRYVLASLVLRFNAFRGGADQAALREARALTDQLRATRELAGQQVRLEVQQALQRVNRRGVTAQESKPSPSGVERAQQDVAAARGVVGAVERPPGRLDTDAGQRLRRKRQWPLADHLQLGARRLARPRAGPGRRRRRTGPRRRRAR